MIAAEQTSVERIASNEQGLRVMLVEDTPEVRNVVAAYLTASGCSVTSAQDGVMALEIASRPNTQKFDLLVTDISLPLMSGRDVAIAFRTIQPESEVLFMSGYSNQYLKGSGMIAEDDLLLEKPFTGKAISKTLRAIVSRKAANRLAEFSR